MTPIIKSAYFQLNLDTVQNVRKTYNLHKPGALDQAICILNDWIIKQDHFIKKDLPKEYLEKFIISAKGSVEIAKSRIDRLYTMQTMVPQIFQKRHAIKDFPDLRYQYVIVMMPHILEDDSRLVIGKVLCEILTASECLDAYQHIRIVLEYAKLHDYAKGLHIIYDIRDFDIADALSKIDFVDLRNAINMCIEAYGTRILSINILSNSIMINVAVSILKQMVHEKIGKRVNVMKTTECLHQLIPKRFLPEDFGGEQKKLLEFYDDMNEVLSSEKHVAHMEEMQHARTNEKLRRTDNFDTEYLGMPGSFKKLSVD